MATGPVSAHVMDDRLYGSYQGDLLARKGKREEKTLALRSSKSLLLCWCCTRWGRPIVAVGSGGGMCVCVCVCVCDGLCTCVCILFIYLLGVGCILLGFSPFMPGIYQVSERKENSLP